MGRIETLLALLLLGCVSEASVPPSARDDIVVTIELAPDTRENDVLLVVDGSPAMAELAEPSRRALTALVRTLASGEPDDGPSFVPSHFVNVAIASTDVGGDGGGCSALGGDGRFVVGGSACSAYEDLRTETGIFRFRAGRDDPGRFAAAVDCALASLHTDCPYSRPLDAIARALDPARETGLVTEGAELAIVVVTAQDDCSTEHPEIFADAPSPLRCRTFADRLRDPTHLADVLPVETAFFGVAAGIPSSLDGGAPEEILAHLDDQDALVCGGPGRVATPGIRLVQLAGEMGRRGARVEIVPICATERVASMDVVRELLPGRTGPALCLPRALALDASERVACRLELALPPLGSSTDVERCEELAPGLPPTRVEPARDPFDGGATAREVCLVPQVPATEVAATETLGWGYLSDPRSRARLPEDCDQGVSLLGPSVPLGSRIELRCETALEYP